MVCEFFWGGSRSRRPVTYCFVPTRYMTTPNQPIKDGLTASSSPSHHHQRVPPPKGCPRHRPKTRRPPSGAPLAWAAPNPRRRRWRRTPTGCRHRWGCVWRRMGRGGGGRAAGCQVPPRCCCWTSWLCCGRWVGWVGDEGSVGVGFGGCLDGATIGGNDDGVDGLISINPIAYRLPIHHLPTTCLLPTNTDTDQNRHPETPNSSKETHLLLAWLQENRIESNRIESNEQDRAFVCARCCTAGDTRSAAALPMMMPRGELLFRLCLTGWLFRASAASRSACACVVSRMHRSRRGSVNPSTHQSELHVSIPNSKLPSPSSASFDRSSHLPTCPTRGPPTTPSRISCPAGALGRLISLLAERASCLLLGHLAFSPLYPSRPRCHFLCV